MDSKREPRFIRVHQEEKQVTSYVIEDQVTGVNYLVIETQQGAGITPLLDSHGKVVITKHMIGDIDRHEPL
ncbi:hypothetical protein A4S06_02470 [Erysipelotrichaceae bacterium MTC7]|nr:hypothetical protein A4S06_02470 [Erysipelotrichaceae bacterium MTC7]